MNFIVISCLAFLATVATVSGLPNSVGINSRIANGQDAEPHAYPYQIAIRYKVGLLSPFQHHCGGSLINNLWVISAAHCFTQVSSRADFQASAGRHFLNTNAATVQSRNVARWIAHPGYGGGLEPHDIALARVASAFTFTDAVAPIALPARNALHTGNVVLTGWGSTALAWNIVRPNELQTVTVPIVNSYVCLNALESLIDDDFIFNPEKIENICTGPLDDSRISACSGDSGGPIAQKVGGIWELVGVVSWGVAPCGTVGAPSVYARTSAYIDWIEQGISS